MSTLNQKAALEALRDPNEFEERKKIILEEKEKLRTALNNLNLVKKIYPSDANFLLVEVTDANKIYEALVDKKSDHPQQDQTSE